MRENPVACGQDTLYGRVMRAPGRGVLVVAAAVLLIAPSAAHAATINVNTNADVSTTGCTLRDAITAADGNAATGACSAGAGADTIEVAVTGQIALGSPLPDIVSGMTIAGPGSSYLDVHRSGGGNYRIFHVSNAASDVTISSLTVSNGNVAGNFNTVGGGGGIENEGTLTLDDVSVTGSSVTDTEAAPYAAGGGVYNSGPGTLHLNDSRINGNTASVTGTDTGGLDLAYVEGSAIMNSGTMTVDRTTIHGNATAGTAIKGVHAAGAVSGGGPATITASTIDGNTTDGAATGSGASALTYGGAIDQQVLQGIANNGALILDRDTVADNSLTSTPGPGGTAMDRGGGLALYNNGQANIASVTIADNRAQNGASGQNIVVKSSSNPNIANTIVSGPSGDLNCVAESGEFNSQGHNLSSDASCGFDQSTDFTDTDPLLRPLGDNGGPTRTMGFFDFSPAKDGGTSGGATLDQRGYPRPFDWVSID